MMLVAVQITVGVVLALCALAVAACAVMAVYYFFRNLGDM